MNWRHLTLIVVLSLSSCRRDSDYWQLRIEDTKTPSAIVTIIRPDKKSATLVVNNVGESQVSPRSAIYVLDGKEPIPGVKILFIDLTLLPGRITLKMNEDVIDIMPTRIEHNGTIAHKFEAT